MPHIVSLHLLRVIETEEDPIWYKPHSRHLTPGRKNYSYNNKHTKRVFIYVGFKLHDGLFFFTDTKNKKLKNQ